MHCIQSSRFLDVCPLGNRAHRSNMHAPNFLWLCALFTNHHWLIPVLRFTPVSRIWCLLFLRFYNSAYSWTMAWTLIVLLNPDQDSFPSSWLCYFSTGHDCSREPCQLRQPELTTQFASLPPPLLLCYPGSMYLFSKPRFLCITFFSKLKSLGLIPEGSYGYLPKNEKNQNKTEGTQPRSSTASSHPRPTESVNPGLGGLILPFNQSSSWFHARGSLTTTSLKEKGVCGRYFWQNEASN